jgi:Ras-related protein Rab-1A
MNNERLREEPKLYVVEKSESPSKDKRKDSSNEEQQLIEGRRGSFPILKKIHEFDKHDYMFRICIIGDASVGKTSLLTRYCDNVFKEFYHNTIGVDFRVISLKYNDILAKIHIWDTAGQERFKSITVNYFRSTHGFMFVYDITNRQSFQNLNTWVDLAMAWNKNSSKVSFVVGNKCDLYENRKVTKEEGYEFANSRKYTYLETSAKTCENVGKAFEYFAYKLIEYYQQNKKVYESENQSAVKIDDVNNGTDILQIKDKKKKCGC